MKEKYKGVIIEESLSDNRILNKLKILDLKITKERNPQDRWHMFEVKIEKNIIKKLSKNIKEKWYMHFWRKRKVIVIFKNKKFEFDYDKQETWKEAINYGISKGIARKQLDFPIN
jgi:hypothetical protein